LFELLGVDVQSGTAASVFRHDGNPSVKEERKGEHPGETGMLIIVVGAKQGEQGESRHQGAMNRIKEERFRTSCEITRLCDVKMAGV
jgi:hypothetical protein